MNKINNKSITFTLVIMAIIAFSLITTKQASAYSGYYGGTKIDNTYQTPVYNYNSAPTNNPSPIIDSISPSSSNVGVGTKTITITGTGFVPSSIARINGSNRPTTFIDNSHLLMQVTGNDTLKYHSNGGFFITVFNGAPGGGYSNAVSFTINKNLASQTATTNTVNDTSSNFTNTTQTENGTDANSNYGSLASNAIFGSNSFMPSSLIQWIFFAIIVLLIVILVRKVYGADKKYHATPMKHD